ncbi:MAG: 2-oxoglutarate and iron-dependent oxygenase domain-containing protein [Hyphomicrobium sp.]|jgi:isopenicillin N synthase-like dioxygenase
MASSFTIPVVDIEPFRKGEGAARAAVARAFGDALENVGFATIVGHGIDDQLLTATYGAMRDFFDLPLEEKLRSCPPEQVKMRGYLPIGIESVAATLEAEAPPDLCEALVFANLSRPLGTPGSRDNIWPEQPAGIRGLVMTYHQSLQALGRQLMRVASLALDLPEDYLDPHYADSSLTLRFVNYPDQLAAPKPGQMRYGAHHDYGGLTILRQDSAPGGLEVCDASGHWHTVPASGDGFVINVGDLMSRWTNGRWRSTLHRVVNPGRELTGNTRRLSMVGFFDPNENTEIACLPSCASSKNPPRWPPVKAGDYVLSKLAKSMDLPAA